MEAAILHLKNHLGFPISSKSVGDPDFKAIIPFAKEDAGVGGGLFANSRTLIEGKTADE